MNMKYPMGCLHRVDGKDFLIQSWVLIADLPAESRHRLHNLSQCDDQPSKWLHVKQTAKTRTLVVYFAHRLNPAHMDRAKVSNAKYQARRSLAKRLGTEYLERTSTAEAGFPKENTLIRDKILLLAAVSRVCFCLAMRSWRQQPRIRYGDGCDPRVSFIAESTQEVRG